MIPLPRRVARDRRARAGVALAAVLRIFLGLAAGCATERPFVWVQDLPIVEEGHGIVSPRDTILVSVRNQPALSGEFVVGDGGDYLQPTLGTVPVEGRATDAIANDLQLRLKEIVVAPQVTVSLIKVAPVRVNVVGEVKTPGSYELGRGRGIIPALAAAGWLTEFADRDRIFVVRVDHEDQRIRFRARELTTAEPHAARFRLRDGDVVVVE